MQEIRKERLCSACLSLCLISALVAADLFAQDRAQTSGSNIQILKLKWEKQMRLPEDFDPSAGSTGSINDPTQSSSGRGANRGGGSGASATTQGDGAVGTIPRLLCVCVFDEGEEHRTEAD